jgi:transcriptional regulator with XRE-family HTH domain
MHKGNSNHGRMTKRPTRRRPNLRPAPPPLFVGQWIRALGKKPAEVAKGAPVNEGYLSEIINGRKRAPSIEVLHAIAVFLGIPREYLHRPPPTAGTMEMIRSLDPAVLAKLQEVRDPTKH